MVLYIIGLGLGNQKDITVRGLQAIKSSTKVYLQTYTSLLPGCSRQQLQKYYNLQFQIFDADRQFVESQCDQMITFAKENVVSFLVAGDPLCATTHTDLFLRAIKQGVKVEIIHNASIMNAIAACGLSLYKFGQTVSVPLFSQKWRPYSFFQKIDRNYSNGFHTLLLLDIKVKQPTEKMLLTGKGGYMPPTFMTADVAASQLMEAQKEYKTQNGIDLSDCCSGIAKVFGVARIGSKDQRILAGKLESFLSEEYIKQKLGGPLHSMVICAKQLHPIEEEMFEFYLPK